MPLTYDNIDCKQYTREKEESQLFFGEAKTKKVSYIVHTNAEKHFKSEKSTVKM